MKFKTQFTLLATAALLAVGLATQAQTTTNTDPTVPGLVSTLGNWVGSYDTNLTFQDIIVWDGPIYQNHVNVGNEIGGSIDIWKQKLGTNNVGLAKGVAPYTATVTFQPYAVFNSSQFALPPLTVFIQVP